ncbi:unnamed protein product [Thelazia callipaeda]|uniref:Col_cuticle_N domain-containing protein n=1 Tax=Thelazia callipaeda TaxID=103827 RepID=A0A0N5DBT9_THECL|nr:unnamed protein product [Thelazia callipaeda]
MYDYATKISMEQEAATLRRATFFGVTFSTTAALICMLSIPLFYNYLQHMQSIMQHEVDFCKQRSNNLWREVTRTQVFTNSHEDRSKRQSTYYGYSRKSEISYPAYEISFATDNFCCGCGISPPGLAGPPGKDGADGNDGLPGIPGRDGPDTPLYLQQPKVDFCFECERAQPGPRGNPGPKGPRGKPGFRGHDGLPGLVGIPGKTGPQGRTGIRGNPGIRGRPGRPGIVIDVSGPQGLPGPTGYEGEPGLPGKVGKPGRPGRIGTKGPVGDPGYHGLPGRPGVVGRRGEAGSPGLPGQCDHCPPPRTAPGY